jgi:hypothetical protein
MPKRTSSSVRYHFFYESGLLDPTDKQLAGVIRLPKWRVSVDGFAIHSGKCRLIKSGTVAGISPTIFAGFNLNLIVWSLLIRCALQR